jgi:hypothetical protein
VESTPEPSDEDVRAVASAWLRYHAASARGGVRDDDPDWWACEQVMEWTSRSLDVGWRLVAALCEEVDESDERTMDIGAGPLETLFFQFGDQAMDFVESAAPDDRTLLKALAAVWCWDEPFRPRLDRLLTAHGEIPGHPYPEGDA